MQEDKTRLYQHMKSVAINLCPNEAGDDYQPDTTILIQWFEAYDRWFKQAAGIMEGKHAYALYNRQVTLFGKELLKIPGSLRRLAQTVIPMGFALSITVDLLELYEDFPLVQSLCEDNLLSSIGIYTDNAGKLGQLTDLENFLNKITDLKRPIGLIGSAALLRKQGLLRLKPFNRTDITLYPLIYESSLQVDPLYPYAEKSCANHLQLYISSDGYLYPCLGLLGLQDYRIGHISEGTAGLDPACNGGKVNLLKLYQEGPDLQEQTDYCQSRTSLPWVCERHRMELLSDA